MVVVVVRDEREVERRGELLGEAVLEVHREERLRRLHDDAHVVDVPDGGRSAGRHRRLGHRALDGAEGVVQTAERRETRRPILRHVQFKRVRRTAVRLEVRRLNLVELGLDRVQRGIARGRPVLRAHGAGREGGGAAQKGPSRRRHRARFPHCAGGSATYISREPQALASAWVGNHTSMW